MKKINKVEVKKATKKLAVAAMAVVMLGIGTMTGVSAKTTTVCGYKVEGDSSRSGNSANTYTRSHQYVTCRIDTTIIWHDYSSGRDMVKEKKISNPREAKFTFRTDDVRDTVQSIRTGHFAMKDGNFASFSSAN